MMKTLNILYRGPLESCNYDCQYCPFAKTKDSRAALRYDKECLEKFVAWVGQQNREIGILFTPWGEALIRRYYQEAIVRLSQLSNVKKVAIQTNLSNKLAWLEAADKSKMALWTTFHPTETRVEKFLKKCDKLQKIGVNFSVGIVGKKEHFELAEQLRNGLPDSVYLWVNAYKRVPDYYSNADLQTLRAIDPLFDFNNTIYKTQGKACFAGETSISIDGEGNITRCHFIKNKVGNIYENELKDVLKIANCTNESCRCYIGYFNLKELDLQTVYGERILERIPTTLP